MVDFHSRQAAKPPGRLRHARSSPPAQTRLDDLDDARSDAVLEIENVVEAAIELVCPKMGAALGINELRGHTKTVLRFSHAALQQITYA